MRVAWLVRLYPRAWRARYEDEIQDVLDQHVVTRRTVVDLLRGVVEARLDPAYLTGGTMPPLLRVRATATTVFALFPLYFLISWAWLIGSDRPHDNDLLEAFHRADTFASVAQGLAALGLLLVFSSLVAGALIIVFVRNRPDFPVLHSSWGSLALIPAAVLFLVAFGALLRFSLIAPLIFVLPFVPLALPVAAGPSEAERPRPDRPVPPAVAVPLLVAVALLTAVGAVLRDGTSSRGETLTRLAIYVAIIAVACLLFALATSRRGTSAAIRDGIGDWLPGLVLFPVAGATLGMLATLIGAIAWTARAWSLPLDGAWHPGIVAEIGALTAITAVAIGALARAAGPFVHSRMSSV